MMLRMGRVHFLVVLIALCACRSSNVAPPQETLSDKSFLVPPSSFQERDLLGHWRNTFTEYHVEELILTSNHQYIQRFRTEHPLRQYEGHGSWRIEIRASGCAYLYLQGMKYFYGAEAFEVYGNRLEPHGSPYLFWERCESHYIEMPDQVILTITNNPTWPRGIGLLFPATKNPPESSEALMLIGDLSGQP